MSEYQPVIGLEIHTQLKTKRKMFCGCPADSFGKEPNTRVCPVCLGLPGAIPSPPNGEAVAKALLVAKALNCELSKEGRFERKHYFYPDLPKGFQISQLKTAMGTGGEFEGIRITRVHLEEDAGKLIHERGASLVDLNRAGVPLLEIVTEPDVESPEQAKSILKELRTVLRHLRVSGADMEKGSLRLEANISLKKAGARQLPDYKVELKNINSFNFLAKALEVEIARQEKILKAGKKVVQETRGYDEERDETYSQRVKEEASDYRYFPEPDLPPLTEESLICEGGVELPQDVRERLESEDKLPKQYVDVLTGDPSKLERYEKTVQSLSVRGNIKKAQIKTIAAKAIVNKRYGDLEVPELVGEIEKAENREEVCDDKAVELIEKAILDNKAAVEDYKAGKAAALQFLVGAVMREAKGRIDPNKARDLLKARLK